MKLPRWQNNVGTNMPRVQAATRQFSGSRKAVTQQYVAPNNINSILRKYEGDLPETPGTEFPVETDAEWALLTKLAGFPGTVAAALNQRTCAPIAVYALEVARLFTGFYHDCPVLAADSPAQTQARAQVCQATLQTLKNALGIGQASAARGYRLLCE